MAYSNIISRTDAQALVPEDVANDLLTNLTNESAAMTLFRSRRLARNQQRLPVLSAFPIAYFVQGDTGLKQTSEAAWSNKYLNVEEIAVIVPIPESVFDDTEFDVWGEIRPLMEQAVGRTLDGAVFFGTNKPSSWPSDIATAATAAGNTVNRGTNAAAAGGIAGDLSDVFATVEADGFDVNGLVANPTYKGRLRGVRDTTGQPILDPMSKEVYGAGISYPLRGLWPTGSGAAEVFAGDFSQGVIGIRQDMTYKILTESVIQDASGNIIFNLAQQDMIALRLVFRVAWQVANIITYDQATESARYPFAVLKAP
jgi:HK97 family phage major capsid protein